MLAILDFIWYVILGFIIFMVCLFVYAAIFVSPKIHSNLIKECAVTDALPASIIINNGEASYACIKDNTFRIVSYDQLFHQ